MSYHRTAASWVLYRIGDALSRLGRGLDRACDWAYAGYQNAMALSCELDREGRVWAFVPPPEPIPATVTERVTRPPLVFEPDVPIRLTAEQAESFMRALREPPNPNPELREAARRYRKAIDSGELILKD